MDDLTIRIVFSLDKGLGKLAQAWIDSRGRTPLNLSGLDKAAKGLEDATGELEQAEKD